MNETEIRARARKLWGSKSETMLEVGCQQHQKVPRFVKCSKVKDSRACCKMCYQMNGRGRWDRLLHDWRDPRSHLSSKEQNFCKTLRFLPQFHMYIVVLGVEITQFLLDPCEGLFNSVRPRPFAELSDVTNTVTESEFRSPFQMFRCSGYFRKIFHSGHS